MLNFRPCITQSSCKTVSLQCGVVRQATNSNSCDRVWRDHSLPTNTRWVQKREGLGEDCLLCWSSELFFCTVSLHYLCWAQSAQPLATINLQSSRLPSPRISVSLTGEAMVVFSSPPRHLEARSSHQLGHHPRIKFRP